MIDIYETFNELTSPENLIYAMTTVTGAFLLSVGGFFYNEFKEFKKVKENKVKKSIEDKL